LGGGLRVVKLGGSVISDKDRPLTPLPREIDRLAREIAEGAEGGRGLIVVHGGGSFGHAVAREFAIDSGPQRNTDAEAFLVTHQAMVTLNSMVVENLLVHGLKAISIPPASTITTENGRWRTPLPAQLEGLLALGLVPVLYGDVVLDAVRGFTILSGDQIAARLAVDLNADRIIFATNVEGVYPCDPKSSPEAQPFRRMGIGDVETLLSTPCGASSTLDVTGGMLGKLREMLPALERGVEVVILDGRRPGNLLNALKGEEFKGTVIAKGC